MFVLFDNDFAHCIGTWTRVRTVYRVCMESNTQHLHTSHHHTLAYTRSVPPTRALVAPLVGRVLSAPVAAEGDETPLHTAVRWCHKAVLNASHPATAVVDLDATLRRCLLTT